jgi:ATP-dependent protease HslVU (ClpYQ) peptidase subunit
MTIVVYRDGYIVSDSMLSHGNIHFCTARKITKTKKGVLAGASGNVRCISEFLKWVEKDTYKNPPLHIFEDEDFNGMIIYPTNRIFLYENNFPYEVEGKFAAIGSGGDVAIGALYTGASALTAVNAAIAHCIYCGGPIQMEKFNETLDK